MTPRGNYRALHIVTHGWKFSLCCLSCAQCLINGVTISTIENQLCAALAFLDTGDFAGSLFLDRECHKAAHVVCHRMLMPAVCHVAVKRLHNPGMWMRGCHYSSAAIFKVLKEKKADLVQSTPMGAILRCGKSSRWIQGFHMWTIGCVYAATVSGNSCALSGYKCGECIQCPVAAVRDGVPLSPRLEEQKRWEPPGGTIQTNRTCG